MADNKRKTDEMNRKISPETMIETGTIKQEFCATEYMDINGKEQNLFVRQVYTEDGINNKELMFPKEGGMAVNAEEMIESEGVRRYSTGVYRV